MHKTVISIFSLAIAVTSLAMSYLTFKKSRVLQVKPLLVFSRRSGKIWQMQNVGNGPALNLCFGEMEFGKEEKWSTLTRCYPLVAGAVAELHWLQHGAALAVTYEDVIGNVYASYVRFDKSEVSEGNRFPAWLLQEMKTEFERQHGL